MQLNLADCSLLWRNFPEQTRQLVGDFARVTGLFELARQYSRDARQLDECQRRLDAVRGKLTRKRYRVGLMGPFQVGKSSAFNRVIGARDDHDKAATEGGGSATTAAITRLFPVTDGERELRIHYLTEEKLKDKLAFLQARTNLTGAHSPESLLSAAGRKYQALSQPGSVERIADDEMNFVRLIDVKYLGLLLHSSRTYDLAIRKAKDAPEGDRLLGEPARWDKRTQFLNHPDKFDKPEYGWGNLSATTPPAVATVDIFYPTDALPGELVIIDTPGLGSMGSIDQWLLDRYVPNLDGAIVVPDATKPMDEHTKFILQRLQLHFRRDFGRRVWIVGAKADGIEEVWAKKSEAGFHNYRALAQDMQIDLSHVSFFTKHPEVLATRFGDDLPEQLRRPELAPLVEAWTEVQRDGGVERLRQIMQRDLAKEIGESLVADCGVELSELERLSNALLNQAIADANVDEDLEDLARKSRLAVRKAIRAVKCEPDWFVEVTRELRRHFHVSTPLSVDALTNMPLDEVFEDHSERLETQLNGWVKEHFTGRAYGEIQSRYLTPLETQRPLQIGTVLPEGLEHAWRAFEAEDRESTAWRGEHFPSFCRNGPFANLREQQTNPFTNEEFVALMHAKIGCVCQQVAQIFRVRLAGRLAQLDEAISSYLQRDRANIDSQAAAEIRAQQQLLQRPTSE